MAERFRSVVTSTGRRRAYLIVLGVFLLLHLFIFRGVLSAMPAIMSGDASVVREELVPFFSLDEYLPSTSSQLTGSDEFRVAYSFWTSWVRYNPILPVMLVLVNTLSVFILFYAFFRIVRQFVSKHDRVALYASVLGALLIHLVLLYAKVAHFYTLILGFSLFALSVSLALEQLLFTKHLDRKLVGAVSVLVLLNPAIHYHIIFYLVAVVAFLASLVLPKVASRKEWRALFKKNFLFIVLVVLLSMVPYLLYLKFTAPATDAVFSQTPVNYWAIFYSSVPLQFLFSLDSLGHVDLYRYGNYLAPVPRMLTMVVFLLVGSLFYFKQWRVLDGVRRTFMLALMVLLLVAMWMSIGYSSTSLFSFHNFLGLVGNAAAQHANTITTEISKMLDIFINVLRYPHRFEFIVVYMAGVLASIALAWLILQAGKGTSKRIAAAGIAALLIIVPMLGSRDYRQTFTTGDFDGFLAPYHVPSDLSKIKSLLSDVKGPRRVFILPSMESGRQIPGAATNYTFLDKYLIYYLHQPTLYNGYGADTANKIVAFMVYRAIAYGEDWWQDILINDLGITHIVVPNRITAREKSITYFPGIERKTAEQLRTATDFTPVHTGTTYSLYKATKKRDNSNTALVDLSWSKFLRIFNNENFGTQGLLFPVQLKEYLKPNDHFSLLSDNPERSFYRLYTSRKGMSFAPNVSLLPFSPDYIASSDFTTNMFSMSTLYNRENSYNYTREIVPSLLNLRSTQFVGLRANGKATIRTTIKVPNDGTYRLVLHAASKSPTINIRDQERTYTLRHIATDGPPKGHIDFSYYYADIPFKKGKHITSIIPGSETILAETIGVIPVGHVPKDFTDYSTDGISVEPLIEQNHYEVRISR